MWLETCWNMLRQLKLKVTINYYLYLRLQGKRTDWAFRKKRAVNTNCVRNGNDRDKKFPWHWLHAVSFTPYDQKLIDPNRLVDSFWYNFHGLDLTGCREKFPPSRYSMKYKSKGFSVIVKLFIGMLHYVLLHLVKKMHENNFIQINPRMNRIFVSFKLLL